MRGSMQAFPMVFACLLAGSGAAAELDFQPGEWEFNSELSLRGEPRATEEWTETKCVSLKELRSGKLFMGKLDVTGCDPGEPRREGGRVLWQFRCLDDAMGRRIEARVNVNLVGDHLEGVTKAEVTTAQGAIHVTTRFKGRRLGACE